MRAALLALALLAAAPSAAALLPEREASCVRWDIVTAEGVGRPMLFHPACVSLPSGAALVWRNDHAFPVDVRAASATGGGADPCFTSGGDRGHLADGAAYRVAFAYDGATLLSRWIDPDGHAVERDCTHLLDPALTTPTRAVLHYRDAISQSASLHGVLAVER